MENSAISHQNEYPVYVIVCLSARNMCAWILRTFHSRSEELMMTLWKSLVLPILDYCSQLWCPSKTGLIQEIEDIQKSFTRKIHSLKRGDYWERLDTYNLYSLQRRRERYRILYVWKILQNIVPNVGESGIKSRSSIRHGKVLSRSETNQYSICGSATTQRRKLLCKWCKTFQFPSQMAKKLEGCRSVHLQAEIG